MSRAHRPEIVPEGSTGPVGDTGVSQSTLLFHRVSGRLSERNTLVDDRDGFPVFRERQTNHIDDLALSTIGFLDRGIVDLPERHGCLAWIPGDRILG